MTLPLPLQQQNPLATMGHQHHPRLPQSPIVLEDEEQKQNHHLTKSQSPLSSPRSPHQQLQTELPTSTAMIGMRQMNNQQPMMRLPEHFVAPQLTTTPVVDDEHDDAKSTVSSLQGGSCPPDPHYDPAKDPWMPGNSRMCDPPAEISIPIMIKLVVEGEEQKMTKPEWLETPEEKKKRKKAEKKAKKLAKKKNAPGHRRSKSLFSMGIEQRDDDVMNKPGHIIQRSFSEESAPTALLKNTKKGHGRTASSPVFNRLVVGPGGRPMYAHQAEDENENDVAVGEDDAPSLSSLKELQHVNYDDFKVRLDSAGDAIDPTTSFTDSFQTHSTLYESSSEHQRQQQQQQASPSPRRGMVRREFQRRFFFFKKNNAAPAEQQQPETKTKKNSSKDKTVRTANSSLAEWKQSSSSCMV